MVSDLFILYGGSYGKMDDFAFLLEFYTIFSYTVLERAVTVFGYEHESNKRKGR
jgi:hypothetical protein